MIDTSSLEPEPRHAANLFGARIPLARQYAEDLGRWGEELGLIGPLELPRLWSRHIVNCGLLAPLLVAGRVGDVGSGAGLPGLVLAVARPDTHLVLIEPMERRAKWLRDESDRLGLANVTVVRARAEDTRLDTPLDQVTARAVTSLTKIVPLTAPLLAAGGQMIFMKGARVAGEVDAARSVMRRWKVSNPEVLTVGDDIGAEPTMVFRATVG